MAGTLSVTSVTELPGGERMIRGTFTLDSVYATGGETMDISAYLSGSPSVILNGDDGWVVQHDRGTSAAGKVLAYRAGVASAVLVEADASTDLDQVVCPFIAIGVGA